MQLTPLSSVSYQNKPSFCMNLEPTKPLTQTIKVLKNHGVGKTQIEGWLKSMHKSIDDKVKIRFDNIEKIDENSGYKVTGVAVKDTAVSSFTFIIDPLLKKFAAQNRELSMLEGFSTQIRTAANNVLNAKNRFSFKLSEVSEWFA